MKNYSIKIEDQTYLVEILDLDSIPAVVRVDGEIIEVWSEVSENLGQVSTQSPKSSTEQVSASGSSSAPALDEKIQIIKSPIPGVITSVAVKPGAEVQQGAEICRLEAMKMSNVIHSPRSGKIAVVHVSVGDHVRHQQPLIEFAEE